MGTVFPVRQKRHAELLIFRTNCLKILPPEKCTHNFNTVWSQLKFLTGRQHAAPHAADRRPVKQQQVTHRANRGLIVLYPGYPGKLVKITPAMIYSSGSVLTDPAYATWRFTSGCSRSTRMTTRRQCLVVFAPGRYFIIEGCQPGDGKGPQTPIIRNAEFLALRYEEKPRCSAFQDFFPVFRCLRKRQTL